MPSSRSRAAHTLIAGAAAITLVTGCGGSGAAAPPTTSSPQASPATTNSTITTNSTSTANSTIATNTTAAAAAKTQPGAVDPNAPEVVAPGDIPDNQAFVVFTPAGGIYTVKVPEGWARTEGNGVVSFTDKYNSIALQSASADAAPTVSSVRSTGLSDVASDPTFRLTDVTAVTRRAGEGVLATYEIGSAPNAVTGKKALLAVERYIFFHNGTTVTLTLSGAKGADNVDPWKIVSDSLAWK